MGGKKQIYFSVERLMVVTIVIAISALAVNALDDWRQREQDPCPEEMVFVPSPEGGFCIDRYENSAGEGCPYPFPMNQTNTGVNLAELKCEPMSLKDKRPWVFVSRTQAEQLCARAGKRLPTPHEWQLAALGGVDSPECHLSKNWPKHPGPAGYSEACRTGSGIYDLAGNAWEWVSGRVQDGRYQDKILPASGYILEMGANGLALRTSNEPSPDYYQDYWWLKSSGSKAIAKGGYYDSGERGGMFATYIELGPAESSIGTGFRCAR